MFAFIFSGIIHERISEIINITRILFDNKLDKNDKLILSKYVNSSVLSVSPNPNPVESAIINIFLLFSPTLEHILMPTANIEPNRITITPPKTQSGIVNKKFTAIGKKLNIININDPIKRVNLLTIFV